ncbi:MAG: family 20 glycosylhydrolase [Actinophytocola sp.]|nr:family 20 glycosylhydrolase [Actinophytocola sp.]
MLLHRIGLRRRITTRRIHPQYVATRHSGPHHTRDNATWCDRRVRARIKSRRAAILLSLLVVSLVANGCTDDPPTQSTPTVSAQATSPRPTTPSTTPKPVRLPDDAPSLSDVIPAPATTRAADDDNFALTNQTAISAPGDAEAAGEYLADVLRPATGFPLPVVSESDRADTIRLVLRDDGDPQDESYRLEVARDGVTLSAANPSGLFNGVHTLRQLLPADIERGKTVDREWALAGGVIEDEPRFGYRGAMLDVARHFFGVDVVKRYIDRLAQYKINYLHLHLADDQGWRVEIDGWPRLTEVGARNEVGGGKGGFYTKQQYREIVAYAQSRGVTIVPEIDMPGHTNAALTSYAKLNCDGTAPPPYTDTKVGFSSLCIDKKVTYDFARDVITQVAEMTPGPYLHIGGDEANSTKEADYRTFFDKVLPMVVDAGKRPIGWHEFAKANVPRSGVVQYWRIEAKDGPTQRAADGGRRVLMSPANKTYLDMKYEESNPWGNSWAGAVDVRTAYEWDPTQALAGVGDGEVLGVEAPLWTELVTKEDEIERMTFPRMQAIAEVGWSNSTEWADFRTRLSGQAERMTAQDIAFHRSPDVPWP